MRRSGSGMLRLILTGTCLLTPVAASANPVILDASSLLAFYVVAFWAFVVEAGIVPLLLTFRGVAPLRVFIGYFIANATVFFFIFQPLLEASSSPPVLVLEGLVVLIDGLVIKLLVTLAAFQGDNYRGVGWLRAALISGIGNGLAISSATLPPRGRGRSTCNILEDSVMRFRFGAVPTSSGFAPDASWKALREPPPWLVQFIAFPIGCLTAMLIAVLWFAITPLGDPASRFSPSPSAFIAVIWFTITPLWDATFTMNPLALLVSFVGLIAVHELVHAAVHPMAGRSPHSILGFWPKCGAFYAHYDGELGRNRFLAIALMPLLVLSILPLLLSAAIHSACAWLALLSAINALAGCGDVLGISLVLFQIPADGILRNQGWWTFWR